MSSAGPRPTGALPDGSVRLFGFTALVLVHWAMATAMRGPLILADEAGYLGIARLLAGRQPPLNMGEAAFYHPGYAALLAPLAALVEDPARLYTGALLANGLLLASLFPTLHWTARRILQAAPATAAGAAGAAAVYPAALLQSNLAWTEAAAMAGFALLPLAAWRLAAGGRGAWAFGGLTAALYLVHPRFLPVVPLAVATGVVLAATGRLPWRAAAASATAALGGVALLQWARRWLLAEMWVRAGEPVDRSPIDLLAGAVRPGNAVDVAAEAIGQAWYLAAATAGLAVAALAVLSCRARRWPAPPAVAAAVTLAASAGVFVASALYHFEDWIRPDHLVYGRYNEAFVPVLVAAGVVALSRRHLLAVAAATAVAGGAVLLLALRGTEAFGGGAVAVNVLALVPFLRGDGRAFVPLATLASLALLGGVVLALRRGPLAGVLLLGAAWSAVTLWSFRAVFLEATATRYTGWAVPARIQALDPPPRLPFVGDPADRPFGFWGYQVWLPGVRLEPVPRPRPGAAFAVAPLPWPEGDLLGARLAVPDVRAGQGLYVLPGAQEDRADGTGPVTGPGEERVATAVPRR